MYTVRKPMTVAGVKYKARAPIDISKLKPALRKRLLSQRRVVPLDVATLPEGAVSEIVDVSDTDLDEGPAETESAPEVPEAAPKAKAQKKGRAKSSKGS